MIKAYLLINAVLYALLATWCTVSPQATGTALGLQPLNGSGRSELLAIYGGLQAGLAVMFAVFAWYDSLHGAGLLAAACIYVPLASWRGATLVFIRDVQATTHVIAALEALLALGALALLALRKSPPLS